MQLSLQSFATLVSNMTATAQGAATQALDFTVGSVVRALTEACASIALWLQYQILLVLQTTRLATSTGSDVDSFVADFGLTRLPGVAASVQVTLISLAPNNQAATVPVGATVRLADASQTFAVYEDTSNQFWNATAAAYIRPAGTASITLPAQALVAGSAGNVQPGTLVLLGTAISGIDTVTNANSATGGVNAETDAALKTRFQAYINSRSGATELAVTAAIEGVQQELDFEILENTASDGTTRFGFFTVLLDDGSGHPSAALIASVYAAINAIRPIGIGFAVVAPTVVIASVSASITVGATYSNGAAQNAAATAIANYITSLGIGATLSYAQLSAAIVLAGTGITGVSLLTVNGGTSNLTPTNLQVVREGTIAVTASGGTTP